MLRSRLTLGTALVLLVSAAIEAECDRRLQQIADAPAPSGSLRTNAKQAETNGALSTTCAFNIRGMAPPWTRPVSREGHGGASSKAVVLQKGAAVSSRSSAFTTQVHNERLGFARINSPISGSGISPHRSYRSPSVYRRANAYFQASQHRSLCHRYCNLLSGRIELFRCN